MNIFEILGQIWGVGVRVNRGNEKYIPMMTGFVFAVPAAFDITHSDSPT